MESVETLSREEARKALIIIQRLLAEDSSDTQSVPATIFNSELSPFQALATYLHNQQQPIKEIARALGRSKQFVEQSIQEQVLDDSGTALPLSIFRTQLSVLEATTQYLHDQGKTNKQIAAELGKSPSTVWITLDRAKQKRGESNE